MVRPRPLDAQHGAALVGQRSQSTSAAGRSERQCRNDGAVPAALPHHLRTDARALGPTAIGRARLARLQTALLTADTPKSRPHSVQRRSADHGQHQTGLRIAGDTGGPL